MENENCCIEEEEEDASTHYFEYKKTNLLIWKISWKTFNFCNVPPVFGSLRAKFVIILIESLMNQLWLGKIFSLYLSNVEAFIWWIQWNSKEEHRALIFSLKRTWRQWIKVFSYMNGLIIQKKSKVSTFSSWSFFNKLSNNRPIGGCFSAFRNIIDGSMRSKEAISILKMNQQPLFWQEIYQILVSVWEQE